MADSSLYDALIGGLGDSGAEIGRSAPLSQLAMSLMQTPTRESTYAHPVSNAEAFLTPVIKGIIASALMSRAEDRKTEQAYDEVRASPLLAAMRQQASEIGPVASGEEYAQKMDLGKSISPILGAYGGQDAPDGWTIKQGKDTLIAAALRDQDERRKQELRDALASQLALAQQKYELDNSPEARANKVKFEGDIAESVAAGKARGEGEAASGSAIPDLAGIPKSLRTDAIKELGNKDNFKKALTEVDKIFDDVKDYTYGITLPLTVQRTKFEQARPKIRTLVNSITTKEMSDPSFKDFEALLPDPKDSSENRELKRSALKELLSGIRQPTPLLDRLLPEVGGDSSKPIPTGEVLNGKKVYIVNGQKGFID